MTMERAYLTKRLAVLEQREKEIRRKLETADFASQIGLHKQLENVLPELKEARRRLLEIDDRARNEAEASANQIQLDARRAERDEAAFWFRRFFTTLGIANAAAFAALASGLLQADDPVKLAPVAGPAMDLFIWGALWAGSIPLLLWARLALKSLESRWPADSQMHRLLDGGQLLSRQLVALFAATSTIMFCFGLFTAAGAVHGLAEGKKVADARVAAERKAHTHAPPPAQPLVK